MGCNGSKGHIHPCDNVQYSEFARAERTVARQQAILSVVSLVQSHNTMTTASMMDKLIDAAYLVAPSERVSLFIVDHLNKLLWALITKDRIQIKVKLGEGFVGCAAKTGETIVVQDAYADKRFASNIDRQTGFKTRSVVALPVKDKRGDVIAVLQFINTCRVGVDGYEPEDLEGIQDFMPFIVPTIQRVAADSFLDSAPPEISAMLQQTFDYDTPAMRMAKFRRAARVTCAVIRMAKDGERAQERNQRMLDMLEGDNGGSVTPDDGTPGSGGGGGEGGGGGGDIGGGGGDGGGAGGGAAAAPRNTPWRGWEYSASSVENELDLVEHAVGMLSAFRPADLNLLGGKLANYCRAVRVGYLPLPYHNFQHALTAMHTCSMLLTAQNDKGQSISDTLSPLECVAVLVAALVHDIGHTGRTNQFEVAVGSPLALLYNDQSPLENHHAATAFRLLREDSCAFTSELPRETHADFRTTVVLGVLGTDMKCHKQHIERAKSRQVQDLSTDAERDFLAPYLLHLGDISNGIHPDFDCVAYWSARVAEEFTLHAEAEKRHGLPVTKFMEGLESAVDVARLQQGFFSFVAMPLWMSAAALFPHLDLCVERLQRNIDCINEIANGERDGGMCAPRDVDVLRKTTGAIESSAISDRMLEPEENPGPAARRANSFKLKSRESWKSTKQVADGDIDVDDEEENDGKAGDGTN